jgi:hypothetical protein
VTRATTWRSSGDRAGGTGGMVGSVRSDADPDLRSLHRAGAPFPGEVPGGRSRAGEHAAGWPPLDREAACTGNRVVHPRAPLLFLRGWKAANTNIVLHSGEFDVRHLRLRCQELCILVQ